MYKVFIVDDERVIAEGLEKLIDWNGLECETRSFTCSAEAYGAAIGEIPDIIITDIKMPFMNGLELIKKLKSEGVDSDVIILSGYSEFEYARKGIELGVNTYLLKPVEQKDLESVVREVINRIKRRIRAKAACQDEKFLRNGPDKAQGRHIAGYCNFRGLQQRGDY